MKIIIGCLLLIIILLIFIFGQYYSSDTKTSVSNTRESLEALLKQYGESANEKRLEHCTDPVYPIVYSLSYLANQYGMDISPFHTDKVSCDDEKTFVTISRDEKIGDDFQTTFAIQVNVELDCIFK